MISAYPSGGLCRRIPFILLALLTVVMALLSATGDAARFSSWWMILLWGLTAFSACVWLCVSGCFRSLPVLLIHSALLMILAGAAVTHFCSLHGTVHLRSDVPARCFSSDKGTSAPLPFEATLTGLKALYYPGTSTPMDFRATLRLGKEEPRNISLNRIITHDGYRFVLTSYDTDSQGASFSVARDSAGMTISYAGYLLFAIASAVCLASPSGAFRRNLRRLRSLPAIALIAAIAAPSLHAETPAEEPLPSLPSSVSASLSRLPVFYNGRVAPFGTLEREFTSTVSGGTSWEGYSPSQVAEGFLFFFGSWKTAPVIKVESDKTREALGLEKGVNASYTQWFDAVALGVVSPDSIAAGSDAACRRDLARFECINSLVSGAMLRLFPLRDSEGNINWYAPTDADIPFETDTSLWLFIRKSPGYLNECVLTRNYDEADKVIRKIALYQKKVSPQSVPSGLRIETELFYNRVARPFIPAAIGILFGTILFIIALRGHRPARLLTVTLPVILWIWVTLLILLRWVVTADVPLASGFETMQFMAWCSLSIALVTAWRRSFVSPLAIIAGSLALLVAAMGSRGTMVTPLMPVLSSPLLSLHVVLVMGAYSLMAIMALAGLMGLLADKSRSLRISCIQRTMLYPAIFLMGTGIFIGAVWANMSWGRYWGWDPKEVWALVTLLTYSFAAHPKSLPVFSKPESMHIFSLTAFLTVLFTYFGVNFLLHGLHSYA